MRRKSSRRLLKSSLLWIFSLRLPRQQLSVPDYCEVVVRGTVTVKSKEQVLFLVEGKQAGIFQISGIGEEDTRHLLNVYCPSIVYHPYLAQCGGSDYPYQHASCICLR